MSDRKQINVISQAVSEGDRVWSSITFSFTSIKKTPVEAMQVSTNYINVGPRVGPNTHLQSLQGAHHWMPHYLESLYEQQEISLPSSISLMFLRKATCQADDTPSPPRSTSSVKGEQHLPHLSQEGIHNQHLDKGQWLKLTQKSWGGEM